MEGGGGTKRGITVNEMPLILTEGTNPAVTVALGLPLALRLTWLWHRNDNVRHRASWNSDSDSACRTRVLFQMCSEWNGFHESDWIKVEKIHTGFGAKCITIKIGCNFQCFSDLNDLDKLFPKWGSGPQGRVGLFSAMRPSQGTEGSPPSFLPDQCMSNWYQRFTYNLLIIKIG